MLFAIALRLPLSHHMDHLLNGTENIIGKGSFSCCKQLRILPFTTGSKSLGLTTYYFPTYTI